MVGQGGLNRVLVDPVLTQISNTTANIEIPLNIVLIVVFLALPNLFLTLVNGLWHQTGYCTGSWLLR